jgi:molybdopterin molybdotransferase/putative molybdopterin biosynthesis protein
MREDNYPITPSKLVVKQVLAEMVFPDREELVPLGKAAGRVTSQNIYSLNTLPNSPTSDRDGIAICFDKYQFCKGDTSSWKIGKDFQFCNTGVAIPHGYDTVITIENVEIDSQGQLQITIPPLRAGQLIGKAGHIFNKGDLLLPRYRMLEPGDLGLLASGGINDVPVIKKPVVAFIPTGNELSPNGITPPLGKNVESNSVMLKAYIELLGMAKPKYIPSYRTSSIKSFTLWKMPCFRRT